jgi:hypothetical protein
MNPPELSFNIERHGGIGKGSTRAEVQTWQVNLDRKVANLLDTQKRQKFPMAKPLKVEPIADEIAALIVKGQEDKRIKWDGASRVRVIVGNIIPSTNKQTTHGRRKRFSKELERCLAPCGWHRKGAGSHLVFERG